jgi:hypothetical protein
MSTQHHLLALIITLAAGTASAQSTSTREFFLRVTTETPELLVRHCIDLYPVRAEELRTEYENFKRKAVLAVDTLAETMPAQITSDEAGRVEEMNAELSQKMLAEVRELDPAAYCPWLLNSMRSTTAESFAARVRAAYARYKSLGESRPPSDLRR